MRRADGNPTLLHFSGPQARQSNTRTCVSRSDFSLHRPAIECGCGAMVKSLRLCAGCVEGEERNESGTVGGGTPGYLIMGDGLFRISGSLKPQVSHRWMRPETTRRSARHPSVCHSVSTSTNRNGHSPDFHHPMVILHALGPVRPANCRIHMRCFITRAV